MADVARVGGGKQGKAAEIRIHGIGNHQPLSALGSPVDAQGRRIRGDGTSEFVRESLKTDRETWFVAWTRTARALNSAVWYLAVPFTLANTAGHMKPLGKRAGFHKALVTGFGLLLTLGAYLWSVTIAETFRIRLDTDRSSNEFGPTWVIWLAWTGGLVWRFSRRSRRVGRGDDEEREVESSILLVLGHGLLILLAATMIANCKPGQATAALDAGCLIGELGPRCLLFWNDWTVLTAAITIIFAALMAVALAWASTMGKQTDWTGAKADPWLGTGLVLLLASLSLHFGAATLNLVVDWFLTYVKNFSPFLQASPQDILAYNALLRAFDVKDMPFQGRDAIITIASPLAWLALLLIVINHVTRRISPRSARRKTEFARLAHDVICETPARDFAVVGAAALVICALAWSVILNFEVDAQRAITPSGAVSAEWWGNWQNRLGKQGLIVGTHLILVVFVAGWFSKNIRTTIAVLGDVVGYWPVTYHPSAALPYRFEVLRQARMQIEALAVERIAVIGHSQGSVLAADLIRSDLTRGGARSVGLVTCGSPLRSLYSRFFPAVFDANRLRSIAAGTTRWVNYWRHTDPIGTDLGLASLKGNRASSLSDAAPLADGWPGTDLKGHSDYWAEPDLRTAVDAWCGDGAGQSGSS